MMIVEDSRRAAMKKLLFLPQPFARCLDRNAWSRRKRCKELSRRVNLWKTTLRTAEVTAVYS